MISKSMKRVFKAVLQIKFKTNLGKLLIIKLTNALLGYGYLRWLVKGIILRCKTTLDSKLSMDKLLKIILMLSNLLQKYLIFIQSS